MPEFYWNPLTISILIATILAVLVSLMLFKHIRDIRGNTHLFRTTLFMLLTFGFGGIGGLLQLTSLLLESDYENYVYPWVGPIVVATMGTYLLFFFHLGDMSARTRRLGGRLLLSAIVMLALFETYVVVQRQILLHQGIVEFREYFAPVPIAVGYVFAVFFVFWHLNEQLHRDLSISRQSAVPKTIHALVWPLVNLERKAATLRAFFYVPFFSCWDRFDPTRSQTRPHRLGICEHHILLVPYFDHGGLCAHISQFFAR